MDFPQAGLLGVLLGKNRNGGSEYGTPQQECPKRSGLGILVICQESRMFGEPACSANSLWQSCVEVNKLSEVYCQSKRRYAWKNCGGQHFFRLRDNVCVPQVVMQRGWTRINFVHLFRFLSCFWSQQFLCIKRKPGGHAGRAVGDWGAWHFGSISEWWSSEAIAVHFCLLATCVSKIR